MNVSSQNDDELNDNFGMVGNWTGAHGDLSVDQFQPHARRVLAKLQELLRGHLRRAHNRHHQYSTTPPFRLRHLSPPFGRKRPTIPDRYGMSTILEQIIQTKRQELAERQRLLPLDQLKETIATLGR